MIKDRIRNVLESTGLKKKVVPPKYVLRSMDEILSKRIEVYENLTNIQVCIKQEECRALNDIVLMQMRETEKELKLQLDILDWVFLKNELKGGYNVP